MRVITHLLFESPLLLIPCLLVGQYVLVVVWLRRRTRRSRRLVLAGLLVCLAAPVVQKLVVTSAERIRAACSAMVLAAEDADVAALGRYVAASFNVRGIDRQELLDRAESVLHRYHVENASLGVVEIEFAEGRALVSFSGRCNVATPDAVIVGQPTFWIAEFSFIDGQWLLTALDPRRTPTFPFDRLEDFGR